MCDRCKKENYKVLYRNKKNPKRNRLRCLLITAFLVAGLLWGIGHALGKSLPASAAMTGKAASRSSTVPQFFEPQTSEPSSVRGVVSTPESNTSPDAWNLLLVNPWHSLPSGYEPTLFHLDNGEAVDERCYPALQKMMEDCRTQGLSPLICSSYRSQETQERTFRNTEERYLSQGCTPADAKAETAKSVAVPGTSEHQLGLAVDIVDVENQNLDESQEDTPVQQWLMKNSWRYGFILRYPNEKSDVTGIIYEPWHYRYVGEAAAKEIYDQGLCLEEYLSK